MEGLPNDDYNTCNRASLIVSPDQYNLGAQILNPSWNIPYMYILILRYIDVHTDFFTYSLIYTNITTHSQRLEYGLILVSSPATASLLVDHDMLVYSSRI